MTEPTAAKNTAQHAPETAYVAEMQTFCDGGNRVTGHPRVYITLDPKTHAADCPYCDRHFVYYPMKDGKPTSRHA